MKRNKYNAKRIEIFGYKFDSMMEAERFIFLNNLLTNKFITWLDLHPKWTLNVNSTTVGVYTADFHYSFKGACYVEDVKGKMTEAASLRIRLAQACLGFKVHIISKDRLTTLPEDLT